MTQFGVFALQRIPMDLLVRIESICFFEVSLLSRVVPKNIGFCSKEWFCMKWRSCVFGWLSLRENMTKFACFFFSVNGVFVGSGPVGDTWSFWLQSHQSCLNVFSQDEAVCVVGVEECWKNAADFWEVSDVEEEKEGAENGTLWNTVGQLSLVGVSLLKSNCCAPFWWAVFTSVGSFVE